MLCVALRFGPFFFFYVETFSNQKTKQKAYFVVQREKSRAVRSCCAPRGGAGGWRKRLSPAANASASDGKTGGAHAQTDLTAY